MERREFLAISGRAVFAAVATQLLGGCEVRPQRTWDKIWNVEWDGDTNISFEEASAMVVRFDEALDMLPKEIVPEVTDELLKNILDEVVPLFESEGFVQKARYPEKADFQYFSGAEHESVKGKSDCNTGFFMNKRMKNPFSSSYNSSYFVFDVVHEAAHVNQTKKICDEQADVEVEGTAQIMAVEVLSHLACKGNEMAFHAVVTMFRDMSLSAAYAAALDANHVEWFDELTKQLAPGAMAQSRIQANRRRFEYNPWGFSEVLKNYSVYPLQRMIEASHNRGIIEGLAIPETYDVMDNYRHVPIVRLDDMMYLVEHMIEMAKDIAQSHRQ